VSLPVRVTAPARSPEQIQREHELNEALEAARSLQARLEMLGDRPEDVRSIRRLRDELVRGIAQNTDRQIVDVDVDVHVDDPPYQQFNAILEDRGAPAEPA
jgi:hypothetical protein